MTAQFSEFNTIEQMAVAVVKNHGWQHVPGKDLPRKPEDVILWPHLRDALGHVMKEQRPA